ncbi:MAG: cadherin-like beta sandwich domain-containing protein, partial [Nitrospira sp.]|nr:cadherin-like beta sandwich domain-containing protein [Nitrospira sp.]
RITVAAPNGTSKTYNITVKRLAPSTDANLFDLRVNSGTLNPGFRSGELNYTVDVASAADSITVSATKSDPDARMSALGRTIANPGIPTGSVTVPLGLGTSTSIEISVVAEDQVSTRTYTINVNRPSR